MKIISWNVNGIRAIWKKGFCDLLRREKPDVLCLQETKAQVDQLSEEILNPLGYYGVWHSAERKGYSGVASFFLTLPQNIQKGLGISLYDREGRVLITERDDLKIYNIYYPNGASGQVRHDFKQQFLRDIYKRFAQDIKNGDKVIVLGDFNIAHRPIDVYDPESLAEESGFLPEEREWFSNFLQLGFLDSFRYLHGDRTEIYSWWSYRQRARIGNRGWRIDYICPSVNLADRVVAAEVLDGQMGSDHCPVSLTLRS